MERCTFTIKNKAGLHARPASLLAQTAAKYQSHVRIIKDGQMVDGKSIMGLMMLAAEQGSSIEISCEGVDEKIVMQSLSELIARGFDED